MTEVLHVSPVISAAAAVDVASQLSAHGIEPEGVFADAGISTRATYDPYEMVRLSDFTELLEMSSRRLNDPAFGLLTGMRQDPRKWGAFGYLLLNSPTIGAAMANMVEYLNAWQTGTYVALKRRPGEIGMEYSITHPGIKSRRQDAELSLAFLKNLVDRLTRSSVTPTDVLFEHGPLNTMAVYDRIFHLQPNFFQPVNALYFPAVIETYQVPFADKTLFQIIKRHLADLINQHPECGDLTSNVAHVIRRLLDDQTCSLQKTAEMVGVQPRTLQRLLNAAGTSFREVLDEVRLARAKEYLSETTLSVSEISGILGFCDASAFIKSFRRWTNTTPLSHREQMSSNRTNRSCTTMQSF